MTVRHLRVETPVLGYDWGQVVDLDDADALVAALIGAGRFTVVPGTPGAAQIYRPTQVIWSQTTPDVTYLSDGMVWASLGGFAVLLSGSWVSISGGGGSSSVPGAPTGLTATAGSGQVALSWVVPASAGTSAITDYVVQYSSNGGSSWSTFADGVSTNTTATVTGLTNGTAYIFRVAAVSSVGTGSYSSSSSSVTPVASTIPGAPTGVTASGGNALATVSWTAPASNGGAAITDYLVQYSSNGGSTWSTFADGVSTNTIGVTVTGLTNGVSYVFRIAAVNSVGTGAYSSASNSVTLTAGATVPGAPTSVTASAGVASATVSWIAPASNGGSAISGYTVQYSSNSGSTWATFAGSTGTATSAIVSGLTNGTGYVFRVAAINSVGAGAYSSSSSAVTPVPDTTPPATPTGLSAVSTSATTVALSWNSAADDVGVASYRLRRSGGSNTITFATPTVYENASATSAVIPVPAGIATGQLLLAQVTHSAQAAPTTAVTGWTLYASQGGADGSSLSGTSIWYRWVTGTEAASYTFPTTATAGRVTGLMLALSNVAGFDTAAVSANAVAGTSLTMPSITTVTGNAVLLHCMAANAATSSDIATLAGTTKVTGSTGTGRRASIFSEVRANPGATGTRVWTITGSAVQSLGITVALQPTSGSTYADLAGATALTGTSYTDATVSGGTSYNYTVSAVDAAGNRSTESAPATATSGTAAAVVHRVVGITSTPSTTSAVSVRVPNTSSVRVRAGTDAAVTANLVTSPAVTPDSSGYATMTLTGLTPNTQYYYRVLMTPTAGGGEVADNLTVGELKTAPTGPASFAFNFGSCTNAADSVALATIAARNDDLFFHLGDLYYADGTDPTTANISFQMQSKLEATNHQAVLAYTPTAYTPSDHDALANNSEAGDAPTAWTNFNTVYRQMWPTAPSVPAGTGLYYTFTWGRVRFIQLDDRSFKSPRNNTDDASKTALGATQKQWLKDTISGATQNVIVILQSAPWIGAATAGDDGWMGYTTERAELGAFFAASGKSIFMLGGDQHALSADDGTNAVGGITVFQAAPFDNLSSTKGGPYSVAPYPTTTGLHVYQYGHVQITDTGASTMTVAFSGYSGDGTQRVALSKTVTA